MFYIGLYDRPVHRTQHLRWIKKQYPFCIWRGVLHGWIGWETGRLDGGPVRGRKVLMKRRQDLDDTVRSVPREVLDFFAYHLSR